MSDRDPVIGAGPMDAAAQLLLHRAGLLPAPSWSDAEGVGAPGTQLFVAEEDLRVAELSGGPPLISIYQIDDAYDVIAEVWLYPQDLPALIQHLQSLLATYRDNRDAWPFVGPIPADPAPLKLVERNGRVVGVLRGSEWVRTEHNQA